ncbi:hypothetical protein, partial [Pseudomonas sp. EL_65y_Pfl1_R83]|uniref:hypothetical protein n=1 Tax=Pseudomonas sp. EL_65y_Pfl1_R83 TaxID=3088697 RepID=UPI0030DDCE88
DGQLIRRIDMVARPYPLGYTPSMVFSQLSLALERCGPARGLARTSGSCLMPVVEYSPLDEMDRADSARLSAVFQKDQPETSDDFSRQAPAGGIETNPDQFLSVGELRRQYLDYVDSKVEEVEEAKDSRRYYHGAQLTAEQLRVLKARHQPVQIW